MTLLQARTTKLVLYGVLFLSGVLFLVPSAFASEVPVTNPSFEILPTGGLPESCAAPHSGPCDFSRADIPGWTNDAGNSGQLVPSISGAHRLFDSFAPGNDGDTSAWSNGGTISQTVSTTVQAGLIYTLTVDIGHRHDAGFAGTADLLVGSTTFMAHGKTPSPGHWSPFTATFVGTAGEVGDHITIQLSSDGIQGNFDSVTLTAVPEPGTLLLFGTGLLLLVLIASRKQLRTGQTA